MASVRSADDGTAAASNESVSRERSRGRSAGEAARVDHAAMSVRFVQVKGKVKGKVRVL
ncbi:hypothetical protein OG787_33680 [Streptomyces sp. NBC_00075]|uniref:hypothetical protein n=1 Tax=Streptomyces sp. NBC_00075 TaxID=2975641 RepID=UPI003248D637